MPAAVGVAAEAPPDDQEEVVGPASAESANCAPGAGCGRPAQRDAPPRETVPRRGARERDSARAPPIGSGNNGLLAARDYNGHDQGLVGHPPDAAERRDKTPDINGLAAAATSANATADTADGGQPQGWPAHLPRGQPAAEPDTELAVAMALDGALENDVRRQVEAQVGADSPIGRHLVRQYSAYFKQPVVVSASLESGTAAGPPLTDHADSLGRKRP